MFFRNNSYYRRYSDTKRFLRHIINISRTDSWNTRITLTMCVYIVKDLTFWRMAYIHTYFWASTLLKCISERDSQLDINFQSRMNQLVKQKVGSGMFVLQNRNVNRSNVFNYSWLSLCFSFFINGFVHHFFLNFHGNPVNSIHTINLQHFCI